LANFSQQFIKIACQNFNHETSITTDKSTTGK